ncbi:MAG: T9SS type A sorting domain-containing protein [Bacteroidia bacterium]
MKKTLTLMTMALLIAATAVAQQDFKKMGKKSGISERMTKRIQTRLMPFQKVALQARVQQFFPDSVVFESFNPGTNSFEIDYSAKISWNPLGYLNTGTLYAYFAGTSIPAANLSAQYTASGRLMSYQFFEILPMGEGFRIEQNFDAQNRLTAQKEYVQNGTSWVLAYGDSLEYISAGGNLSEVIYRYYNDMMMSWVNGTRMTEISLNAQNAPTALTMQEWDSQINGWDPFLMVATQLEWGFGNINISDILVEEVSGEELSTLLPSNYNEYRGQPTNALIREGIAGQLDSTYRYSSTMQSGRVSSLLEEYFISGMGWSPDYRNTFTYDAQGRLTSAISESHNGMSWEPISRERLNYNAQNHLSLRAYDGHDPMSNNWQLFWGMSHTYSYATGGLMVPYQVVDSMYDYMTNAFQPESRQNYFFGGAPTSSSNLAAAGIKAYPNPFAHQLTLEVKAAGKVEVVDMAGRLVKQQQLQEGHNLISTDALPKGMYVVRIYDQQRSWHQLMQKQ